MITRDDCMSILVKLEDSGLQVDSYIKKLYLSNSKDIPFEVLEFISKNRGIEVSNFYDMLRRRYNEHKSKLYKNIVGDYISEDEAVVVLTSLLTQIVLYNNRLNGDNMFIQQVRAEEISRVLHNYFETGSVAEVQKLLRIIKSDLLVLEFISGRRELQQ